MIDAMPRAHERAIGDVAIALGADEKVLRRVEIGVACPGCGGTDRFVINHGKNIFLCRASGAAGDPIDLVRHVQGCSVRLAVEWLTGERQFQERAKPVSVTSDDYRQKARERGYRIWRNGYAPDKHVPRYFELRHIPWPAWRIRTLREADRLPYWHWSKAKREFRVIHEGPALLAAITGPDGKFIGVHRTWLELTKPSGKAEIFDPETGEQLGAKKVEGSMKGGKIVLRDGDATRTVIGEGIETVLSWDAMRGDGETLWSGVALGNISGRAAGKVMHPTMTIAGGKRRALVSNDEPLVGDECLAASGHITLLGDGDSDPFTTQMDMARAVRRLSAERVEWADNGMDWNDAIRGVIAA